MNNLENGDLFISYPFPLSNGSIARLYLPFNISKKDVGRLIKAIEALPIDPQTEHIKENE